MPQTNYERGRRIEYKVMRYYEDKGYLCFRSAGSHGPFDVIAIGKEDILLIQVKYVQSANAERESNFAKDVERIKEVNVPCPLIVKKRLVVYRKNAGIVSIFDYK